MSINKLLSDVLTENEEVLQKYSATIVTNAKKTIDALKHIIRGSNGIEAVRWHQSYSNYFQDDYSDPSNANDIMRNIEFKFNNNLFPLNEEEYNPEDGFVSELQLKEYVERGMDVMNVYELTKVENDIELIMTILKALITMEQGLKTLFGRGVVVTVTKFDVITNRATQR